MSVDYHIDKARRLVVTTAKGIMSKYELLNCQARIRNDSEFDPTFSWLHDARGADFVEVYEDCVEALSRNAAPRSGTRRAIVIRDAIGGDLAGMFANLQEGMGEEVRVFRDLDSANSWLEPTRERAVGGRVLDRRVAPRFSIQVPTEYEGDEPPPGIGITENLSTSGVLVEHTSAEFPIDTELRMRFSFFHGSFETVFTGAVVRYTDDGFAARFVHLGTDQIEVLRRVLSLPPPL